MDSPARSRTTALRFVAFFCVALAAVVWALSLVESLPGKPRITGSFGSWFLTNPAERRQGTRRVVFLQERHVDDGTGRSESEQREQHQDSLLVSTSATRDDAGKDGQLASRASFGAGSTLKPTLLSSSALSGPVDVVDPSLSSTESELHAPAPFDPHVLFRTRPPASHKLGPECAPIGLRMGRVGNGRIGNQLLSVGKALATAWGAHRSAEICTDNKDLRPSRRGVPIWGGPSVCIPTLTCAVTQSSPLAAAMLEAADVYMPFIAVGEKQSSRLIESLERIKQRDGNCSIGVDGPSRGKCHPFTCTDSCKCGHIGEADEYGALRYRFVMATIVAPKLWVPPALFGNPSTLVVHLRSGDILSNGLGTKWPQPPLYEYPPEFHPY